MFNKSRRSFIKSVAYGSALTVGGLSSVTMAAEALTKTPTVGAELVNLINHTSSSVSFKSISGTGLTDIHQYLATKENQQAMKTGKKTVTLAPGEQHVIAVKKVGKNDQVTANTRNVFITDVLEGHLKISSDYADFNGIFPIAT